MSWLKRSDPIKAILTLHTPVDEEAEVYCQSDSDAPDTHAYEDCPGHIIPIQVCGECGYTYTDETVGYRPWPCPTVRALDGET